MLGDLGLALAGRLQTGQQQQQRVWTGEAPAAIVQGLGDGMSLSTRFPGGAVTLDPSLQPRGHVLEGGVSLRHLQSWAETAVP